MSKWCEPVVLRKFPEAESTSAWPNFLAESKRAGQRAGRKAKADAKAKGKAKRQRELVASYVVDRDVLTHELLRDPSDGHARTAPHEQVEQVVHELLRDQVAPEQVAHDAQELLRDQVTPEVLAHELRAHEYDSSLAPVVAVPVGVGEEIFYYGATPENHSSPLRPICSSPLSCGGSPFSSLENFLA